MRNSGKAIHLPQYEPPASGPGGYWRSLEELAGNEAVRLAAHREFPPGASEWPDAVSRRNFLKVMGASLALAGTAGCFYKRPQGVIAPATRQPEETIPGMPIFFASAMPFDGYAKGVLVESNQGRPTKIEGNPDHPASLGAADIFMQASVLDLYDPDRSRAVLSSGTETQWGAFYPQLRDRLDRKRGDGTGLALLTGPQTSPLFAAQLDEFRRQFPKATWHQHHAMASPDAGVFQQPVRTIHDFSKAGVIVSLAADFLTRDPASVRYARQFIDGRRVRQNRAVMNRLYVAEGALSLTGSMADHRLRMRPSQIQSIAWALAEKLGVQTPGGKAGSSLSAAQQAWVDAAADDLRHPGQGEATLVLAGESQPSAVHALVHLINEALGNVGKTVWYIDPVQVQGARSLAELVEGMRSGAVDTLLIFGGNPAYDAPADVDFAAALQQMSTAGSPQRNLTVRLGSHYDETSFLCQWHLPEAHWLESWGDVRAFDGTTSIIQPLIEPLYGGRSQWEIMDVVLGNRNRGGLEILREYWMKQYPAKDFEQWWMKTLQDGYAQDSALASRTAPPLRAEVFGSPAAPSTQAAKGEYEVLFQPDPCTWDGQFANNGWMQELPKPFTKLVWDNAVLVSVSTAAKLGGKGGSLVDGDILRIDYRGRSLEGPLLIVPGQADDLLVLQLGYGRWQGGELLVEEGQPRGYNAYRLRTSDALWADGGASVKATDKHHLLVQTRNHHAMAIEPGAPGVEPWLKPAVIAEPGMSAGELVVGNRRIVRTGTLRDFQADPHFIDKLDPGEKKPLLSLYPSWDYQHGMQWGMVIDQTACIGCNACVLACQSENNSPVVGKNEVSREREMHWIRIDSYFGGPVDEPTVFHQPVPCMHCEDAPCEVVCPVGATTHSDEGINEMTYNRCIGTRYCSNNCPYKVRRFNFLLYADYSASRELQYNPDVTVRTRGVMEKCTYCIQRINETRIMLEKQQVDLDAQVAGAESDEQREKLKTDGQAALKRSLETLQTACQQSCPTGAIIFGDIRDPDSQVKRLKDEPTNYSLLGELTTLPRTTYLARITNPNPKLPGGGT
jgi:molybdopterin-containing oxidoreductase family iron-sulfur binding subunit